MPPSASTLPPRPISWGRSGSLRMPSNAKAPPSSPTSCSFASVHRGAGPPRRYRLARRRPACDRGRRGPGQPLLPEPSRNGPGQLVPQGHALRRRRLQRHEQRRSRPATQGSHRLGFPEFEPSQTRPAEDEPHSDLHASAAKNATSPREVSSSARTGPSIRSKAVRPCRSSMAARR